MKNNCEYCGCNPCSDVNCVHCGAPVNCLDDIDNGISIDELRELYQQNRSSSYVFDPSDNCFVEASSHVARGGYRF